MKVLHIGNIANNAYWNAKILNDAGYDNVVICYDYYHVMGCPEWEETHLTETPADHFYPRWHQAVDDNYVRPPWFIQGSQRTCLEFVACDMKSADLRVSLDIESGVIPPMRGGLIAHLGYEFLTIGRKLADFIYLRYPKLWKLLRRTKRLLWRKNPPAGAAAATTRFASRVKYLCEQYRLEFPDSTPLTPENFLRYERHFQLWESIFQKYDFVIGYGMDGIHPLLAGVPYAALEHGTIRDTPYEDSVRGRLCKLIYRMANHCFVTNLDCVDSARFLSPGRFSILNHPFDETVTASLPAQHNLRQRLLSSLDASFLIFHPTRQDWNVGTGPADKANDKFWRAVGQLRLNGIKVGVVCTKWGRNVTESIKLIKDLGIQSHVEWIQPQATLPFLAMCMAADLIADQFHLGAFGGIMQKALACGTPVLTYLDQEQVKRVFPEPPPILNCRSEKEIALQIDRMYRQRDLLERLAEEGKRWVATYHSKDLIKEEVTKILGAISKETANTAVSTVE